MIKKLKTPYVRDVYLAYLIANARRTKTDNYPIIEEWMVATKPPKEIIQWDRRRDVKNANCTGMCFYCSDFEFQPILGNPKRYIEKIQKYQCIVGMDASAYDNMPIWVQKSQIGLNLSITYYYGSLGMKVIPNVRLGDYRTISSLEAYPKHTLISIGTNGFVKTLKNRNIIEEQLSIIIDILEPTGILVYGQAKHEIFWKAKFLGIPIYQYDSYTMKENQKDKQKKIHKEDTPNEG